MITFITGNQNKLREAREILGDVEGHEIDLPEIQEVDPHIIIKAKMDEAKKQGLKNFIVEDTSLYFDGLNGLPGPLIKWFLDKLGNDGLYDLVKDKDPKAQAKTIIGYSDKEGKISYHEGIIEGEIVAPKGDTNFGWDPIFKPDGHDKTFAEMGPEEKNTVSMRKMALEELKKYLTE
ncbi:MAG: non-canonical purine NTP pyrophosphatase [Patescibacteria group bacterium]|nr:non-canonical purine NTP pyrophosphatase [Patescibacteria group bacterium]